MRKGENIRKRKDGLFEARYFDKINNKYVSVYGKTYSEAKQKRNHMFENTLPNIKSSNQQTMNSICMEWLEYKKPFVKHSTYSKYYDTVFHHILPILGKIKIILFTQNTINQFIISKMSQGLSVKTVKDICIILNQILKSNKLIFEYVLPAQTSQEVAVLSNSEYKRFIGYLILDTDSVKLGLLISLCCGIRIGELCALRWDDIDFKEGLIKISKTLQRIKNTDFNSDSKTIVIIDTPKTQKSIRVIPIPKFLLDIMISLKSDEKYYVLTGNRSYTEPRTLDRNFKKYLKACGIPDNRFHALRHTFATKCIENNFDYKTLSELLGHTDARFTISRYVHSSLEQKRVQMQKLNFSI